MDQLVALVSEKTGIPQDKATQAVDVVVSFLKERLPAPIAGQIDGLLGEEASAEGESAGGGLGGILGG